MDDEYTDAERIIALMIWNGQSVPWVQDIVKYSKLDNIPLAYLQLARKVVGEQND